MSEIVYAGENAIGKVDERTPGRWRSRIGRNYIGTWPNKEIAIYTIRLGDYLRLKFLFAEDKEGLASLTEPTPPSSLSTPVPEVVTIIKARLMRPSEITPASDLSNIKGIYLMRNRAKPRTAQEIKDGMTTSIWQVRPRRGSTRYSKPTLHSAMAFYKESARAIGLDAPEPVAECQTFEHMMRGEFVKFDGSVGRIRWEYLDSVESVVIAAKEDVFPDLRMVRRGGKDVQASAVACKACKGSSVGDVLQFCEVCQNHGSVAAYEGELYRKALHRMLKWWKYEIKPDPDYLRIGPIVKIDKSLLLQRLAEMPEPEPLPVEQEVCESEVPDISGFPEPAPIEELMKQV